MFQNETGRLLPPGHIEVRAAQRPGMSLTRTRCRTPTFDPMALTLNEFYVDILHNTEMLPVKQKTLIQCWANVGSASQTVAQH